MLRLVVLIYAMVSASEGSINSYNTNAASKSQIEFAKENNYDGTGRGAKGPEYAYKTYKTLEDAVVSYLDDPDTKLPEREMELAKRILARISYNPNSMVQQYPRYNNYITTPTRDLLHNRFMTPQPFEYQDNRNIENLLHFKGMQTNKVLTKHYYKQHPGNNPGAFRFQKIQITKNSPLNLAHYMKDVEEREFNPNPHYSYSYGVNDDKTGDKKNAQETREDGVVKGFYTFKDADGQQRTVIYTADEKNGFRANVQRTY